VRWRNQGLLLPLLHGRLLASRRRGLGLLRGWLLRLRLLLLLLLLCLLWLGLLLLLLLLRQLLRGELQKRKAT
jgi:hypothetical protein